MRRIDLGVSEGTVDVDRGWFCNEARGWTSYVSEGVLQGSDDGE